MYRCKILDFGNARYVAMYGARVEYSLYRIGGRCVGFACLGTCLLSSDVTGPVFDTKTPQSGMSKTKIDVKNV